MKIKLIIFFTLISLIMVSGQNSFHDFVVTDIQGNPFPLSQLKGKKVLIVNTASKCGFTPQYEQLEKLYQEYGKNGFIVIGFPSNNFFRQEPGSNDDILAFCQKNYGVSFPMMSKISVKGQDMHPLYKWLTKKELNGRMNSNVTWNFQKYLIDEEGELIGMVVPKKSPYSPEIVTWLEGRSAN
jgi:glutathione peroxidase